MSRAEDARRESWTVHSGAARTARTLAALGWRRGLSRWLSFQRRPVQVEIGRVPCWLDLRVPLERHLLLGFHDGELFDLYREWLRPGDVAVDVGANVGLHTAVMANRVGAAGRVISLEPNPALARRLRRLIDENPLHNVELFQVAASATQGTAILYAADNHGLGSLEREAHAGPGAVPEQVETRSLDDVLREAGIERVRLLKIDVEGHEPRVLDGLARTLEAGRVDTIVYEIAPWRDEASRASASALAARLTGHGFRCYGIQRSGLIPYAEVERNPECIAPGYNVFASRVGSER